MASEKIKFRKQRRTRSFVSLENLDEDDSALNVDEKQEESKVETEESQTNRSTLKELHPTYILQKAYNRTKAIGSTTAMVAI